MSFPDFRSAIDAIVADMGGGSRAREAVGKWFSDTLRLQIGRYAEMDKGHYGQTEWYSASDAQFEAATRQANAVLTNRPEGEETAQAPYRNGRIVVYQTRAALVTPNQFFIPLAFYSESSKYDGRQQKMVPDFMVSLDRPGETMSDTRFGAGNPTTTHAKTAAGAYKSLRSMVEKQFHVSLENVND